MKTPEVGQIYSFVYQFFPEDKPETCELVVTKTSKTHVWYKLIDKPEALVYTYSHAMLREVWDANKDERVFLRDTTDPDALHFVEFASMPLEFTA